MLSVSNVQTQTPPTIDIPNKIVGGGLEQALRSDTYQKGINLLQNLIVTEKNKASQITIAYDIKTQQAFALTLIEFFNQRLSNPTERATRNSLLGNILVQASACPIFTQSITSSNLGPTQTQTINWNSFCVLLMQYIASGFSLTSSQIATNFFDPNLELVIQKNAQYGISKNTPQPSPPQQSTQATQPAQTAPTTQQTTAQKAAYVPPPAPAKTSSPVLVPPPVPKKNLKKIHKKVQKKTRKKQPKKRTKNVVNKN
ncbi:MAG: hypothetical protein V1855_02400 [bacterium]